MAFRFAKPECDVIFGHGSVSTNPHDDGKQTVNFNDVASVPFPHDVGSKLQDERIREVRSLRRVGCFSLLTKP